MPLDQRNAEATSPRVAGARLAYTPEAAASRTDWLVALGFCLAILTLAALCIPFRTHVYGVVPNFLQVYGIVLGSSELLTAILLLWRARLPSTGAWRRWRPSTRSRRP